MPTIDELVETIPEHERDDVRELATNVLFMRKKLAETRMGIARQQVVIPYDNGGGQTGIRRNPAFDGYLALLKSYQSAIKELRDMLGKAPKEERTRDNPLAKLLVLADEGKAVGE